MSQRVTIHCRRLGLPYGPGELDSPSPRRGSLFRPPPTFAMAVLPARRTAGLNPILRMYKRRAVMGWPGETLKNTIEKAVASWRGAVPQAA